MSVRRHYYAAYGSNLHPLRLTQRIDSARLVTTALVPDVGLRWHKRGMDGSGKCDLVEADDGAWVAVFELSQRQLGVLDTFEGPGYRRVAIIVPGVGECLTYRAHASHVDPAAKPYAWYQRLVQRGSEYHRFPDTYTAGIARVASMRDPDGPRGEKWRALAESLRCAGS